MPRILLCTLLLLLLGCEESQRPMGEIVKARALPASADTEAVQQVLPDTTSDRFAYQGPPCGQAVVVEDSLLTKAATGIVHQPVRVELLRCADRGMSIRFSTENQQERTDESWFSDPNAMLADVNFDGHADLWIDVPVAYRARLSRIWLYAPAERRYVWAPAFSSLIQLEVAPEARRLLTHNWNCGCAAECFWFSEYEVRADTLYLVERHEQADCTTYRHWVRDGASLRLVRQMPGREKPELDRLTNPHRYRLINPRPSGPIRYRDSWDSHE